MKMGVIFSKVDKLLENQPQNQLENFSNSSILIEDKADSQSKNDSEEIKEQATVIRKDLQSTIKSSLNDPRSPSLQLNRTPLILDDISVLEPEEDYYENDESIDMNKTYTEINNKDTLNTTPIKGYIGDENDEIGETLIKKDDICSKTLNNEIDENASEKDIDSPNKLSVSTKQQEFDPRSPSLGVERTPIIFAEQDGCFISTEKTLDFASSLVKNEEKNTSVNSDINIFVANDDDENAVLKTFHSRLLLSRMRNYRKMRKNKHFFNRSHNHRHNKEQQKIYEDQDTQNYPKLAPKQHSKKNDDIVTESSLKSKRNPLTAVDNCSDLRLRSLDLNTKNSDF